MTIHLISGSSSITARCTLRFLRTSQYFRMPMIQISFVPSNSSAITSQWYPPSCTTMYASSSCASVTTTQTYNLIRRSNYGDRHGIKNRLRSIHINTAFTFCNNDNNIHPSSKKQTKSFGATRSMNTDQNKNSHPSSSSSLLHFATTDYADSFVMTMMMNQHLNHNESNNALRQQALQYLNQTFDPKLWFNDPVCVNFISITRCLFLYTIVHRTYF